MTNQKITNISLEYFSDYVYNLELESEDEDHDDLFWIEGTTGVVTHNCFPKDLNALISVAKENKVKPTVMEAVWKKNLEIVSEENRDWEKMGGRAVSNRKAPKAKK